jgi:RloB-like protein
VLIVTNGKDTELDYFNALREESWVTADKITPKFINGAPVKAVIRAAAIRAENEYDEAWVVCDVDEFGGVFDAADRAKGLGEPPDANPSTVVWRVIESLRAARDLPDEAPR